METEAIFNFLPTRGESNKLADLKMSLSAWALAAFGQGGNDLGGGWTGDLLQMRPFWEQVIVQWLGLLCTPESGSSRLPPWRGIW